jgi:ankyrin repeat protein
LCLAISKQNTPIFNLLLDYKASISNPCANGHTPLTTAVFCHNYPILDLLLKRIKQKPFPDKSKILNAATEEGKRALHYAVCNKHLDIVIRLLGEAGIDINATDNDGNTALHLAVMIKDENIIEALMRKKARIDISNKEEKTPLSLSLDSPRINQILQDPRFQ